MAITTVDELYDATLAWVNRENSTSTRDALPNVLALLEADLYRRLRVSGAKIALDIPADAESVAIPLDVGEVRTWRYKTGEPVFDARSLLPRSIAQLNELRAQFHLTSGQPRYFAVLGCNLEIVPKSDALYTTELVYTRAYRKLEVNPALLAIQPDLYLYGMLWHLSPYLEHDERADMWGKRYEEALTDLNLQREREEFAMLNRQPQRLPRVFGGRP